MFDIGWTELLVIAVVAIVVIGPKDLPRAMRAVGQWTSKIKRMAGDFQRQFNEAVREAELEDVRKEVASIGKIDPMADLRKSLAKAETGLKTDLKKVDDGIAQSLAKPDTVVTAPKASAAVPAAVENVAPAVTAPAAVASVEPGDVKA